MFAEFVFNATLTGVLLVLVVSGAAELRRSFATRSWPVVPGVITSNTLVRSDELDGPPQWWLDITYAYTVSRRSYIGRTVRFGGVSRADIGDALKAAARYPVGSAVEVRFDPRNPSVAVLEVGFSFTGVVLPVAIAAVMLIAVLAQQ